MADIASLFPRQTIEAAENGDLEPLLERLRASDLNAEESVWIERRLKGDPSAKMRAGPKRRDNRDRDLTIVYLDEWLRLRFGETSAENRHIHLSKVKEWSLKPTRIRNIIENAEKPDLILKLFRNEWRNARFVYGAPDKHSPEIPELLRDALNSSE